MDIKYAFYSTSKGYRVLGGTAAQFLKADGSIDSKEYIDKYSAQNIEGDKWFRSAGGNQYLNHRLRIISEDGSNPGLVFYKSGVNVGTIQYSGVDYFFTNSDTNAFSNLVSAGYIKEGSNNNFLLLGGGGHKAVSDFVSPSDLNNRVPYSGANQDINLNNKSILYAQKLHSYGSHIHSNLGLSVLNDATGGYLANPLIKIGARTGNMITFTVKLYNYPYYYYEFQVNIYIYNDNVYEPRIIWRAGDSAHIEKIEFFKDSNTGLFYIRPIAGLAYPRLAITDVQGYAGDGTFFNENWSVEWGGDTAPLLLQYTINSVDFSGDSRVVNTHKQQTITARKVINKDLGTNDYIGVSQHNAQFQIGRVSDLKSLEFAVTDDGVSYIQSKEAGVGYRPLVLNRSNSGGVGIGAVPISGYGLTVGGSVYSSEGYYKQGSDNNSVLLAGGDSKPLSEFAPSSQAIGYLSYQDNRVISPNEIQPTKLQYGFTSWNNNNIGTWADFLHFGGYPDPSGGNQNLIMFHKNSFGIRQYQESLQNSNPYTKYVDYLHTGNFNPASYVTQSSLNTQLGNYAALNGIQTFTNTNTFLQSPVIPNGTLGNHAVNLNQLNTKVTNEDSVRGVAFDSGLPTGVPYFIHTNGTYVPIATQSWVSSNYISTSHIANTITLTSIQHWNYMAQYGLQLNSDFAVNTGSGLLIADDYFGGETGMVDRNNDRFVSAKQESFYKYGSRYGNFDGLNFNLDTRLFGMGRESNKEDKLTVEGSVKASKNFKSEEERPDTIFIPNGNVASLGDEIVNDESEYAIRLDPHEYEIGPSGYLDVDDRNRLIHIIGEHIKMVVNFKEIYPKQQIVIYNFDKYGGIMAVKVYGKDIYHIPGGSFLRLYVTKSRRVIAERDLPCEFVW